MMKNILGNMLVVTLIFLLIIFALALLVGAYFFGVTGFFAIFGVTYDSPGSLLLFILLSFVIGFIFEIPEKILALLIGHKFITFAIECFFTWLAIHIADEMMDSITIPLDVEIIACMFLFVIQQAFEDIDEKNEAENI
ncbi:YrvL family regulatory protein [Bacillus glycinifermentans]|uniref:YrvL family regulatory protein n=1 Tax=Bacillus glycinifermentans TaxID=1664069 RepID=UPI002DB9A28B|nr:YrvL family regulatory protein [Bacillus glycinifermentans]MEC3606708.1 YrvL family regulatory protein [Bacillus glycinifermentans]